MLATATRGPKVRGTPGQAPESSDAVQASTTESKPLNAPKSAKPETVVVKDLTKRKADVPAVQARDPVIEADTVEEALELANKRNRAVFCPEGWVCPSIIRERR